jgi:hypothetical protein
MKPGNLEPGELKRLLKAAKAPERAGISPLLDKV